MAARSSRGAALAVALSIGLATAAAAGPPVAADVFRSAEADIALYGGYALDRGFGGVEGTGPVTGARGRANLQIEGWNLQVETEFSTIAPDAGLALNGAHFFHTYRRDPSRYAYGAFIGFSNPSPYVARPIGVDLQAYLDRVTLYAQASVWLVRGSFQSYALQLRGQATYFPAPNSSLALDLAYAGFQAPELNDAVSVIATGAHRFAGSSFGVFLQARWDHVFGAARDRVTGLLGLRIDVDPPGTTLIAHGRTGPAMDVLLLPIFNGGP